jgi:peptidoglycan/LPS O-acetylase OafA/YrhL
MPQVEGTSARRPVGRILLAIVFAIVAISAWMQVVLVPLALSSDPLVLTLLQAIMGIAATAAAWGSWAGRRWAPWAALVYAVMTAGMLIVLGPLLGLPTKSRHELRLGAVSVVLLGLAAGWYLGRNTPSYR